MTNSLRAAVLADVHSNHIALEAALNMLSCLMPDRVIFLGDYISDCPYPQKTMELLYQCADSFDCLFIRGNREDYMLSHRENPRDGWCYSSNTGSLLYTYENLTPRDLDFFTSMPICADIEAGGGALTACHASPARTKEWILTNSSALQRYSSAAKGEILLCGHTHRYRRVECGQKSVLFCPSVGLPQDRESDASFLLLEYGGGEWRTEPIKADWDAESVIAEFEESGLDRYSCLWSQCVKKSLRERLDYPMRCVSEAWKLAADDGFEGKELPEKYWNAAAINIGVKSANR